MRARKGAYFVKNTHSFVVLEVTYVSTIGHTKEKFQLWKIDYPISKKFLDFCLSVCILCMGVKAVQYRFSSEKPALSGRCDWSHMHSATRRTR
jgi:hypothetical protein